MDLCDINVVKPLLEKHGFHFSKSKGQNFLIRAEVPENIARLSGIDDSCGVLEVGPGFGCLTAALSRYASKVLSVEIDETLRPVHAETLADYDNITVLYGDILKQNIPELVKSHFSGLKPVAAANLPYYITGPILSALLESEQFSSVTVMVQKEVAERICATPGKGDYGAFSVFCQYYAKPEILFDVSPSCFLPAPKVTSAVLKLNVYHSKPYAPISEKLFFKTVHAVFATRRKTLLNSLALCYSNIPKQDLTTLLDELGFSPTLRGETLSIPEFISISNALYSLLNK